MAATKLLMVKISQKWLHTDIKLQVTAKTGKYVNNKLENNSKWTNNSNLSLPWWALLFTNQYELQSTKYPALI